MEFTSPTLQAMLALKDRLNDAMSRIPWLLEVSQSKVCWLEM